MPVGDDRRLAGDLKDRGVTFIGPTTAYAFMQAMGLVNDHVERCDVRSRIERARRSFSPPADTHDTTLTDA